MRAQILSIGSELILGHLTDTNATFLAQQLAALGIELTLVTQVGDDLALLASVIERARAEVEVVICTGGVGPTADDLTREAIARVMGETPAIDNDLLETIRAFFRSRGLEMPERNSKQAWLIPSAEALPNPVGTAPGWFVLRDGRVIAAMPGVPREMFRMWTEQIVPRLTSLQGGRAIRSTTIKSIGIGESAAEQLLHDLVALENPVVATYAKDDGVHVRVTASAPTEDEAERLRNDAAAEVTRRLNDHVYGTDDTTLPGALASALSKAGLKLAVSDAGGGGRFASLMAGDPASAERLVSGSLTPSPAGTSAMALASEAIPAGNGDLLGLGISVDLQLAGDAVYEGTINVAIAGPVQTEESMPMRSGFEDVQRRSALFAADVLRCALRSRSGRN
jgi:nicotinamide-nucleotide amidase